MLDALLRAQLCPVRLLRLVIAAFACVRSGPPSTVVFKFVFVVCTVFKIPKTTSPSAIQCTRSILGVRIPLRSTPFNNAEKFWFKALVRGASWPLIVVTFRAPVKEETLRTEPKLSVFERLKSEARPKLVNRLPVSLQVKISVMEEGT